MPPEGYENNWIQTLAGKGWFMILRLYGPLEPWFDKTWRPGEITPVNGSVPPLETPGHPLTNGRAVFKS